MCGKWDVLLPIEVSNTGKRALVPLVFDLFLKRKDGWLKFGRLPVLKNTTIKTEAGNIKFFKNPQEMDLQSFKGKIERDEPLYGFLMFYTRELSHNEYRKILSPEFKLLCTDFYQKEHYSKPIIPNIDLNLKTPFISPKYGYELLRDTKKPQSKINLKQEEFLKLQKKAIIQSRPLLILIPLKDESSGTFSKVKKVEGIKGKYTDAFSYQILNIGVQTAKEVFWKRFDYQVDNDITVGRPINPEIIKKIKEKRETEELESVGRNLAPEDYIRFSDMVTFHFKKDFAPEAMPYIYELLLLKWEITYKYNLNQKKSYKTAGLYQINKDKYSIISIYDE